AYLMYFFGNVGSFSNHGEILNPVIDISTLKLKDDKNALIPEDELRYKWRMISFVGATCDDACNKRLHDVRQIHKSLAKDQHRVIRMIVHLEPASDELNSLISKEYPNALNVFGNEKTVSSALGDKAMIRNNETYIMDPIGNVMMRFSQDQPNRLFLKDFRKLLKVSQIG
ncbi:MAG: SCO family protein, partial [Arenicellales bacterium]